MIINVNNFNIGNKNYNKLHYWSTLNKLSKFHDMKMQLQNTNIDIYIYITT